MQKVSIIMPVYNSENYVKCATDSILNQSYKNIELLIIDDGSNDGTMNICKQLSEKNKNIIFISQKNSGVSYARNEGIKRATGDYIMFIDHDDSYETKMVECLVEEMNKGYDWVSCNYNRISQKSRLRNNNLHNCSFENDNLYKGIEYLQSKKAFNILWNKIYKTDIIKNNNIIFNTQFSMGEDYRFNIEYAKNIKSIKIVNIFLYNYYIDSNGLSKKEDKNEFLRRIANINLNRDLYIYKNYRLDYINKRYIDTAFVMLCKQKYKGIGKKEEIMNNQDLIIALNTKNKFWIAEMLRKILKSNNTTVLNILLKGIAKIKGWK